MSTTSVTQEYQLNIPVPVYPDYTYSCWSNYGKNIPAFEF